MLVNDIEEITVEMETPYSKPADVKYICYDGYDKDCTFCMGVLELLINGEHWKFSKTKKDDNVYPSFFAPTVCYANGGIEEKKHTGWETDISAMPEELRCFAKIIDEVINSNMPNYVCCGCD